MANVFETLIGNGMLSVMGDPAFIGAGIMAFFVAAVCLVPTHPALKVLAFFGAVVLALPFLNWGLLLFAFGGGFILWFALRRIWG